MRRIIVLLMSVVFLSNLYAVDIPWTDKKLASPEKKNEDGTVIKQPDNSLLTIDGLLWFGYERTDSRPRGSIDKTVDSSGAKSQPTGFTINRGYFIMKGEVKEGEFKGFDYRVTIEANSAFESAFLKHGYFSAPIPGLEKTWLRFGQQDTPTVDGQAGSSLTGIWGKRYLDQDGKAMWDELGLSPAVDLGVSFLHKADLFGVHLMVANGEGFKKLNGQSISNSSLTDMSKGSGDSHGVDFTGLFSLTPLPKDSEFGLHINFPFRLHNVSGIHRKEYDNVNALSFTPTTGIDNGTYKIYRSDARAKQDRAYGVEVDGVYKAGSIKATLGVGHVTKIDQQNNAYMIDQKARDINKAADVKDYVTTGINPAQDRKGMAQYIFAVFSYGKLGLISRYSTGTANFNGSNGLSDKLGTGAGVNINNQMLHQDLKDDGILNMSPEKAAMLMKNGTIETGKSTFKKITIAVEYQVTPKFFVALGFRDIYGTTYSSGAVRINEFNDITGTGYTANNLANNTLNKQSFSNNLITDNDMIGVRDRDRQIFIRSMFMF